MNKWLIAALFLTPQAACDEGGANVDVRFVEASYGACNSVFLGGGVVVEVDNTGEVPVEVIGVSLETADETFYGHDELSVLVQPGLTVRVSAGTRSCVDPAWNTVRPGEWEVGATAIVSVRDANSGVLLTATVTGMLDTFQAWDNCSQGYGPPGEGCGTFGVGPYDNDY